jgi:putative membrane protein
MRSRNIRRHSAFPAGNRLWREEVESEREEIEMNGYWYFGWGWLLWLGLIFVLFSSFGNWGYTYRAHRKFDEINPKKEAIDILNERYAKGEISREEFHRMKSEISGGSPIAPRKVA